MVSVHAPSDAPACGHCAQVAYRAPGSQQAAWVDLYNRLYRERILFLGQQVADDIANQMIGVMLFLDSEDNSKPVYMYINSPGGFLDDGLQMIRLVRAVPNLTCIAENAFSMAFAILQACDVRAVLDTGSIMQHLSLIHI